MCRFVSSLTPDAIQVESTTIEDLSRIQQV